MTPPRDPQATGDRSAAAANNLGIIATGDHTRNELHLPRAITPMAEVPAPPGLVLLNECAVFLRDQGNAALSLVYQLRSMACYERTHGADHPYTLTARNNLANAYESLGDLKRAVPLFERTLADRERLLGADHPDTLMSRNNLASAYQDLGDLERAVPLYERTLADLELVSGVDHPNTLLTRNNLANAYQSLGLC